MVAKLHLVIIVTHITTMYILMQLLIKGQYVTVQRILFIIFIAGIKNFKLGKLKREKNFSNRRRWFYRF